MDLPTPPPPFSATARTVAATTTVVVHGEVDTLTGPELEGTLTAAWAAAPASLLVDLSAATFVNASALAVLFRASATARARAAGFDVLGLPRPVERFLAGRQLTLAVIVA